MKDLVEALTLLLKYGNPHNPTHCEHDQLYVCGIDVDKVTFEDKRRLDELGFGITTEYGEKQFYSHRFGSA